MDIESLGYKVLGLAIEVHKHLGPGLLERAYESCLIKELEFHKISYQRQLPLTLQYKGEVLDEGYRLDLVVDRRIILELKCVDSITPIHLAQILTYLKLSGMSLGYIINFNTKTLMKGVKRVVSGHDDLRGEPQSRKER